MYVDAQWMAFGHVNASTQEERKNTLFREHLDTPLFDNGDLV